MIATIIFIGRDPFDVDEVTAVPRRDWRLSYKLSKRVRRSRGCGMLAAINLEVSAWSALPFVALLLAIALLPLTAPHVWESNRHKAFVAALASLPVLVYLLARNGATQGAALRTL